MVERVICMLSSEYEVSVIVAEDDDESEMLDAYACVTDATESLTLAVETAVCVLGITKVSNRTYTVNITSAAPYRHAQRNGLVGRSVWKRA
jgi:hypothetical protein